MAILTEYEKYLRVPELLALQKPEESRTDPDELLFQCVHQVEELWMKVAIDEIGRAVQAIDGGHLEAARAGLHRIFLLEKLMGEQLRLLDTMSSLSYFHIRAGLGHGSGLESPGFNRVIKESKRIDDAFARHCQGKKLEVIDLLRDPERDRPLFAIAEALIDIDGSFQEFRYRHYALVKRIIGSGTPSLKGNAIELLERNFKKEFFPTLWAARETLFQDFAPGPLQT